MTSLFIEEKERHVLFLEEKQMTLLLDGFLKILIDIIVLWKEKKDVYYFFEKKINNIIA